MYTNNELLEDYCEEDFIIRDNAFMEELEANWGKNLMDVMPEVEAIIAEAQVLGYTEGPAVDRVMGDNVYSYCCGQMKHYRGVGNTEAVAWYEHKLAVDRATRFN